MSSNTVNLDAMITRADFASDDQKPAQSSERFEKIALKDLVGEGVLLPKLLRKPDFQRETTQWKPARCDADRKLPRRRANPCCNSLAVCISHFCDRRGP